MKTSKLVLVAFVLITGLFLKVNAAACDGGKSAFMDAVSNDSHNITTVTDLVFGESRTIAATVGPSFGQRSGGQAIFTAPGSGSKVKTATITITTSEFLSNDAILDFAIGPMTNGFTSCANRLFPDREATGTADSPSEFKAKNLDSNDGTTSYVFLTPSGVSGDGIRSFGASFKLKVIPGQDYEATCGTIAEKGASTTSFDCNITIEIDGASGNAGGNQGDDEEEEEPVEVTEKEKIQAVTRTGNCPFTALEHLNIAIRTEQAAKAKLDEYSQQLEDARLAVSDAGINPGPALRKLDALVEFIRDDVGETRDATKAALRFSQRHLVCAKEQIDNEASLGTVDANIAKDEIDQAITNDDEAITAIMTENSELSEEAIRIKSTLESTSSKIDLALNDKEQAGESMSSSFSMPDFASEDVDSVVDEVSANLEDLNDGFKETLAAQSEIVKAAGIKDAVDPLCDLQNDDCINELYDDLVAEYTKLHTAVKIKLAAEKAAAEAAEEAKKKKLLEQQEKVIDKGYVSVVRSAVKTKKKIQNVCTKPRSGSDARQRKITALLKVRRLAVLKRDRVWQRMIDKVLKKIAAE